MWLSPVGLQGVSQEGFLEEVMFGLSLKGEEELTR
jgi:hypothetical protein